MRRAAVLVPAAAMALLAACSAGGSGPPDWQASPANPAIEGPGAARVQPLVPVPSPGTRSGTRSGGPSSNATAPKPKRHSNPAVVATHLVSPVGLALLPDGTALVGERTTGRIVQVQPEPGRKVRTIRVLHGLDTRGDGGLLDLAVSPTYVEDDLVYAYITTPKDNRVVEFTLHGPVTPVFTGIPKGPFDNTGRIMFGADGDLYIGTGDAGRSRSAERTSSLAGKVLRVTDIGADPRSNPVRHSPVWTSGHRVVDGLCTGAPRNAMFDVEAGGPGKLAEVNVLERGDYYGWPTPTATEHNPLVSLPPNESSPGGCAVLADRLWVTSLDGRSLLVAPIRSISGPPLLGPFKTAIRGTYGRLRTVVAAPDGALWLTTSNRDGHGAPVPTDERVIRYVPSGGSLGGSRA